MQRVVAASTVIAAAGAVALTAWVAWSERAGPARCPPGALDVSARCCAPGQQLRDARCAGEPARCPSGLVAHSAPSPGCVFANRRVPIRGGRLSIGPSDWEAQGKVVSRIVEVGSFAIDSTEVTIARWTVCTRAGDCAPLPTAEPGVPVTNVTLEAATRFCRFVGGRLPSGDEWLMAAAGEDARRFPWGPTGLVCRRAAFGLVDGPCAAGGIGPDLGGMRPDGATPDGVLDLAGNVAEWTVEPGGAQVARGGSFRSKVAGELKSWAVEELSGPSDHVGFRCAYDSLGTD